MRKPLYFCLILFIFIWGCKSSSPTSPDSSDTVEEVQILSFTLLPSIIARGDSCELEWDTKNATTVTIEPDIGEVSASGIRFVYPENTKTYTLTVRNSISSKSESKTVTVKFARFKVQSIKKGTKSYGSVYFYGKVKNTGNNTAWNADITIYVYSDENKQNQIDRAWDYLKNGNNIKPGEIVNFEAICFNVDDPKLIKSREIEFDWLERSIGSMEVSPQQMKAIQDKAMKKTEVDKMNKGIHKRIQKKHNLSKGIK
jgi:hypothetical protein